jgi:hypothetical protein
MMQIGFTCNKCKTRVHKQFSKHAYTKGLVIITCPGCQVLGVHESSHIGEQKLKLVCFVLGE